MLSLRSLLATVCLLAFICLGRSQGGPPMITDDPGTVPKNHVECNVGVSGVRTRTTRDIEAPLVDFNYGWSSRLQFKVELPWIFRHESRDENGLGNANIGLKWRFQDESANKPAISIYPAIEINEDPSSSRRGIVESATTYVLPIEIAKSFGKWEVASDAGLTLSPGSGPGWFVGSVVGKEVTPALTFLAELHLEGITAEKSDMLLAQIGCRCKIHHEDQLLLSCGTSLFAKNVESDRFTFYAGICIAR